MMCVVIVGTLLQQWETKSLLEYCCNSGNKTVVAMVGAEAIVGTLLQHGD
jgi:hypothetical protein